MSRAEFDPAAVERQGPRSECHGENMSALPEWMHPPRPEGWLAEDLDRLPEAPRHTELIDGALAFMMSHSGPGTVGSSPPWLSPSRSRRRNALRSSAR
jgi:hypothetical protein